MSTLQGSAYTSTYTSAASLTSATVTCTVTAPDGTTSTPTVTVEGQNTAQATIPATQLGTYLIVFTCTIAAAVVDVQQDQFTVVAAGLDFINLTDLKSELHEGSTTYDTQLRRWLKASTFVIENLCDPLLPATRVDVFDGGGMFVVLPVRWASAITSVVETIATVNYDLTEQPLGFSTNNYGYTWDRTINKIVRRGAAGVAMPFTSGVNNVSCTYTVGLATIPDDIQMAAAALVRHWFRKWNQSTRGSFNTGSSTGTEEGIMVGEYFVPNGILELLAPWLHRPGIF